VVYAAAMRSSLPADGAAQSISYKTRSLEEEHELWRTRNRRPRFLPLDRDARMDRCLGLPQLHQTNGEHDRCGVDVLFPHQHFQKGEGFGQKLMCIIAPP
jgi:hypothetical protein